MALSMILRAIFKARCGAREQHHARVLDDFLLRSDMHLILQEYVNT
jgi:hypothetical protein